MIAGLIIVGLSSHSLGVLAAGGDYIADSAAICLGLLAIRLRDDKHGHPRATTFVAAINASFLLIITTFVVVEAARRLSSHAPHVQGLPAMIMSIIATIAMIIGAIIISGDEADGDLHMRSVLLDTVADGASSAAVAITGGIIYVTKGFYWLDSTVALLVGLVIGFTALKLLWDVRKALIKNVPIKT